MKQIVFQYIIYVHPVFIERMGQALNKKSSRVGVWLVYGSFYNYGHITTFFPLPLVLLFLFVNGMASLSVCLQLPGTVATSRQGPLLLLTYVPWTQLTFHNAVIIQFLVASFFSSYISKASPLFVLNFSSYYLQSAQLQVDFVLHRHINKIVLQEISGNECFERKEVIIKQSVTRRMDCGLENDILLLVTYLLD